MDTLTEEQILEKYEQLPHDLKEAIFSVEMTEAIKDIGAKYKLAIDKIGTLANESGMVMFGATRPKDFVSNIMSRLGVNKDTADKIASDVNSQVFLKVRESLKKLHGGEEMTTSDVLPPTSDVKKEDILKVLEHPELPAVLAGTNKPEEVQNLFEVKTKEEMQRAPMEESKHEAPKYKESDPYREPIV